MGPRIETQAGNWPQEKNPLSCVFLLGHRSRTHGLGHADGGRPSKNFKINVKEEKNTSMFLLLLMYIVVSPLTEPLVIRVGKSEHFASC
jgi:hypothetical protein